MKKRFLARRVVLESPTEKVLGLSVVVFDTATGHCAIEPFTIETASTAMVDGTIIVEPTRLLQRLPNRPDKIIATIDIIK
ncbi:MAG: hypothetical protein J1E63_01980 [Muribaculaceae bacterium]|nr:hypothetical protein [Muribaculaceae bacterium]